MSEKHRGPGVGIKLPPPKKRDEGDTRKEQISLAMGTAEYQERVRDLQGIDEQDFVADDDRIQFGDDKRPDDLQEPVTEAEHVKRLAGDLRKVNYGDRIIGKAVGPRQYRARVMKEGENGKLIDEAVGIAMDEPKAPKLSKAKTLDKHPGVVDLVYNDGEMQDDYVEDALEFL